MDIVPSNSEITEIAMLAERQLMLQAQLDAAEKAMKEIAATLRQVQEIDLPNAMAQAGVQSITLPSGEKITIKEDISVSLPKDENYHPALDWLREHGYGDVIKNEYKVGFGRGQEEMAAALQAYLESMKLMNATSVNMGVHHSTLKALVKEMLANGVDFPTELFVYFPITKAIIK